MAEISKLGRYELRRILGKGAMGVVYEGFDPSLNRAVAVKTILKSVVTDEETAASYSARFVREAKAAARLSHANIVQVYDFGEQDDIAYLVMEFIQGRELRACFEARDRFDATEAVRIMGELLSALEFAHEAGVIHRDVKPANVMLDAQRRVKLADFGVARMQDGTDRSKGGTMVGTPAFMSPEQISGGRVDRRTDVFSAGIVLYQLLTAEQPFKGEGAWTVAKQIMQDEPPRPSTIVGRISPAFDRIVSTALAKNPEHRFASAKEFAAALEGALAGEKTAGGQAGGAQHGSDAEIEFWRSIQSSTDPAEFEVYLKGFPEGIYADLARLRISRLPRIAANASAPAQSARDTGELKKLAEETARLEAELAERETAYKKRAAEAEAKRLAEEQARTEAEAKREAEASARAAAEEKARVAAIEKAQQEAKAEVARREAEIRQRETEFRRRQVEAAAAAAAAAKADAEASAKRIAEEKARHEADAKARLEAQEQARKQADEIAKRQAAIKQREADLKRLAALAPRAKLPTMQLAIGFALVAGAVIGAWYWATSSDEARLAQLTVALEAATKATQELNVARQRQDELRKRVEVARLAEDDARAKGDQAKLKELQEQTKKAEAEAQKQNELVKQREAEAKKAGDAAKVADAQKQSDVAKAAEKAAQEKTTQSKAAELAAAEKAAVDKAAAEKAAADKAAIDKLAAEKASADKRATEKAAAAKTTTTAARPGWPSVGDRWVYEAHDSKDPAGKFTVTVEIQAVSPSGIREVLKAGQGADIVSLHGPKPFLIEIGRRGAFDFAPYLRAFQEIRAGEGLSNAEMKFAFCMSGSFSCNISARVAGREHVSVKAGNFDTWKIEVEAILSSRIAALDSRTQILTFWYADEVRRHVKYQLRCKYCTGYPEIDMELVSHARAGASTAEKSAAPVSVAAIAAEGVLPGRYAFRVMAGSTTGTSGAASCGSIHIQEDIEIPADSSQRFSGRGFADLRFRSAKDDSVTATLLELPRDLLKGDMNLAGRTTDVGYAGTYERKPGSGGTYFTCTGQWTLVRK